MRLLAVRWLHTFYTAIDANFNLVLKARGINDPELGSGWAYFVEQLQYTEHIKKNMKDKDVSTRPLSKHV